VLRGWDDDPVQQDEPLPANVRSRPVIEMWTAWIDRSPGRARANLYRGSALSAAWL